MCVCLPFAGAANSVALKGLSLVGSGFFYLKAGFPSTMLGHNFAIHLNIKVNGHASPCVLGSAERPP